MAKRNEKASLQRLCPRKSRSQHRRLGRSSGFRIVLLAAPSRERRPDGPWLAVVMAAFVPGYSGGTATDLHRFPYSSPATTSRERHPVSKEANLARSLEMSTSRQAWPAARSCAIRPIGDN